VVVSLRFGYVSNGLSDHRLEDALELLAENGYTGVALTLDHIHFDPLAPRLRARAARLRSELEVLGMDAVVETGARFVLDPRRKHFPTLVSDGRQRRVDLLCTAVDVAAELGAPVVSMWSGVAPANEPPELSWDLLVDGCERVLAHAAANGVTLAFEPEPGMLVETLADYERLAERLGHPAALGLTLDIGHIVCLEPMTVTECVRRGAPTLAHVHIEDMKRGVHEHLEFGTGELDLEEALAVLTEVGYEGMVAVELSRHSHAAHEAVPRAMAALRAAEPTAATGRFASRRPTTATEVAR
jgi:sugar phosphate isomerase/epimerase